MEQLQGTKGQLCTAKVKKLFEIKDSEYGKSRGGYITVNGKDYSVYFKERFFNIAVEGAILTGVCDLYKGKPFWTWYSGGDGQTPVSEDGVITQKDLPPSARSTEPDTKPDWDKIAEGKVRHGICVAYIQAGKTKLTPALQADINEWVTFIIT